MLTFPQEASRLKVCGPDLIGDWEFFRSLSLMFQQLCQGSILSGWDGQTPVSFKLSLVCHNWPIVTLGMIEL